MLINLLFSVKLEKEKGRLSLMEWVMLPRMLFLDSEIS